jgi:VanZ family protein
MTNLNDLIRRKNFIPAYLFSLLLWAVASLPGYDLKRVQKLPKNPLLCIILSDPSMHFVLFGLLALLILKGFSRESKRSAPLTIAAMLAIVYGLFIEVYQGILPWRTFGLEDLFWNTMGVLFFLGLAAVARILTEKKSRKWMNRYVSHES